MSLQDDINLLIKYLRSLRNFEYVNPGQLPYLNMGATITEAILQAGTNYSTVVKPRVMTLLERDEARTTDGFQDLLIREGTCSVLNWKGTEKPKRIHQLTGLLSQEGVQNELDLKAWMQDDRNIEKLRCISGIGNKTIDYLRILSGISTTAVDRHILRFLKKAGIEIGIIEYERARSIVNETAIQMRVDASTLDHSIWAYMSNKAGQQQNKNNDGVNINRGINRIEYDSDDIELGPYNIHEIVLCSADASPTAQKEKPDQAQYFFPGAKWVGALRNAANRLSCDFLIITTAHGMVNPTQIISPYDMHINEYPEEVEEKWRVTIPAMVGSGRYKLMIFYAGGCPRDEMLSVMLPILSKQGIDLLTFGKPNMFDVGKIDQVVQLLISGTSISEIKSLLKVPGRLKFYQCEYGDNLMKDFDKTKGIIFGLAIGDALGWPTEFMPLSQIKSRYGNSGITDLPDPALFTDDTQMSIAIAEALIKAGEQDVESIMAAIKYEFIKWKHSPENNRAPGKACLNGVANLENGIHWSKSGVPNSKGCGSAMRVGTIGYIYQNDPVKLKEVAHATGICTHGHPTGDAACIGAAYLVKLAIDGIEQSKMIPELLSFTSGISDEFDRAILKINKCLDWEDEEKALEYLGKGWIGEEAVALALYCFLRYTDNYRKMVIRAANTNGDSDSIACIAGSISGAYLGINAIPNDWVQQIEKSDYLDNLAMRLTEKKESLDDD